MRAVHQAPRTSRARTLSVPICLLSSDPARSTREIRLSKTVREGVVSAGDHGQDKESRLRTLSRVQLLGLNVDCENGVRAGGGRVQERRGSLARARCAAGCASSGGYQHGCEERRRDALTYSPSQKPRSMSPCAWSSPARQSHRHAPSRRS